jgi:5-methylcytosine-specific restriction enzyme A
MPRPIGKRLNKEWSVGADQALYRQDGRWCHILERFPAALFDENGYLLFGTKEEYETCKALRIGKELNIPCGISAVRGYVKVREVGGTLAIQLPF